MVESVLPKNIVNRVSFKELLRMEDAFNSHPLSTKRHNWHKKTSQEHLYHQLFKLFPEEGILIFLIFFEQFKKFLKNINIQILKVIRDIL